MSSVSVLAEASSEKTLRSHRLDFKLESMEEAEQQ